MGKANNTPNCGMLRPDGFYCRTKVYLNCRLDADEQQDVFHPYRNERKELVTVDPATMQEEILAENLPEGSFSFTPDEKTLLYTIRKRT